MTEKQNKTKSFYERLIIARSEITNPKRRGKVDFQKSKYVALQDLYDAVLPPLLDQGLIVVNPVEYIDGEAYFVTKIIDSLSDSFLETKTKMNPKLNNQEQGSERTYLSRYNLGCLLSIRTDFDDDAESTKDKKPDHTNPQKFKVIQANFDKLSDEVKEATLKHYKIESIEKLPVDLYDKAIIALEKALKKQLDQHCKQQQQQEG